MAGAGQAYPNHAASPYLASYPPRQDDSFDEFKQPYDDDIIQSYAAAEVRLPQPQQPSYYPNRSPYISPISDRRQSHNLLFSPKQDERMSTSDVESTIYDGGTITGSSYNIKSVPETPKQESTGFWESLLPDSIACRLYVFIVLLETIIDIAIQTDLFLRVKDMHGNTADLASRRLPVYLGIFAFAHVFQLGMAIDAVHNRNTLQFLFLTVFNALFLLYAIIQALEIRSSIPKNSEGLSDIPVNVLTTITPIVICLAEVAYIALGWRIWQEFGWKVYKRLGANRKVKRMFAQYQIFVCIMKFDVFFFIGFSTQLILLVLNRENWEWYVTCAALPFSLLLLVDGVLAAKYENRHMMITFMLGLGGALVYFSYKLFKIAANQDTIQKAAMTLAVFAIIAILLLIGTFVMAVLVLRNFGEGLKTHMSKNKNETAMGGLQRKGTEHHFRHQSLPLGGLKTSNRMSID